MNTHQATSDFNFVTTTRTIAEARLRFGYVTPSQAAWLKTFFRQSETTLEDYLMDPNIAADPQPALFLHQLHALGLLEIEDSLLRPTSETCACYQLLNGLHIAGENANGDLAYYRDRYNSRYLSHLVFLPSFVPYGTTCH